MANPSVPMTSQAPMTCENCGVQVRPGSCYNSMGTEPLILCNDCYAKVVASWDSMADDPDARKSFIVDTLSEGPATRRYLSVVPKLKETIKSLERDGYSFSFDDSWKYVLSGSPELKTFAKSLATCGEEDGEWLRRTYSDHWGWLSSAYSDSVGRPRTDDPATLISYCAEANAVPERYERMSRDSDLRRRTRMNIREQVLVRLIDQVMAECDGVLPIEPGRVEFKGVEITYGPIVDESMIGEDSGFSCDILVSEDSVDCFVDEDIVPFVDYFEQGGNERVVSMLDFMCQLRRRGLRRYPSSFLWTAGRSPCSCRPGRPRSARASPIPWPRGSQRWS